MIYILIKVFPGLKQFRPKWYSEYPPHQEDEELIEEFFFQFIKKGQKKGNSKKIYYIPIFWTNYFMTKNYGKNIRFLKIFIKFFNFFTKKLKKFTIVQFAGGTKVPLENTIIFSSAGSHLSDIGKNSLYIPIPLISKSHSQVSVENKKYKVGFVGRDTHTCRQDLAQQLSGMKDYKIKIVDDYNNISEFEDIMNNSIFSLCPRGTSPTSFRLYEALESGSIPIYVSDEHWLPFNDFLEWEEFCILLKPDEISKIPFIVDNIIKESKHLEMITKGKKAHENYFTLEKTSYQIITYLHNAHEKN